MDLFVLRHGEAGARMDAPESDAERALTVEGRREITRIATALQMTGSRFDIVASSPLKRAAETAEIVARKFKKLNRLEEWDELKPTSDPNKIFQKLSRLGADSKILLVGHEPNLTSLIGQIIAGKANINLVLKKGGLAKVRINAFKPTVSGELRWLLTPKTMTRMSR